MIEIVMDLIIVKKYKINFLSDINFMDGLMLASV